MSESTAYQEQKENKNEDAILDAASRYYGQYIAQNGIQALAQVWSQLNQIYDRTTKDDTNV